MTPSSELALTSLVVVALVAAAAIISIAALGQQARYGFAGPVGPGAAMKADTLDKAEFEVLDLDLYPFCLDVGDGSLPAAPGVRATNPDGTILQDSASRDLARGSFASANGGRATEGRLVIPGPAPDRLPRPKLGPALRISALGCGLGSYK